MKNQITPTAVPTFQETERFLKELSAGNERKLAEQRAEIERERAERERKREKEHRLLEKQMKETARMVGGIANSNGDVAESYFINSFKKHPYFAGQAYQIIDINAHKLSKDLELEDEYDLVLYNGTSVVIIEIKYNAKKEDVEQVLKKAETFRKLVPQYKDYALYLALAGLHVYKNTEQEAKKHGIAIIKQVGKHQVIIDEYLKAR